jgi:hypothetical protein
VVFHVKSTFPLESFDWLVLAKNVIVNSGRETAGDIFTQTFTFRQLEQQLFKEILQAI